MQHNCSNYEALQRKKNDLYVKCQFNVHNKTCLIFFFNCTVLCSTVKVAETVVPYVKETFAKIK